MILTGIAMVITIAGAILAVSRRNVVHAVFGLAIALVGVALAFLALNSPFVAAMQVLIYIGGITIAMIFAVMLSATRERESRDGVWRRLFAGIAALLFFVALAPVLMSTDFGTAMQASESAWSLNEIGNSLLDQYNVVFELLSVVLLLAIIGAIAIARHEPGSLDDPTATDGGDA